MPDIKGIGRLGEEIAKKYLLSKGYIILDRNYRTRLGEIDIVARDGKCIVFVEVKARHGIKFGYPREAVHANKQLRIRNIASLYITNKRLWDNQMRFDVVEIIMKDNEEPQSVVLIKDAF